MPETLIAILAGGEGRRIGGGKPALSLGGETLLARAIRIGRSYGGDVRAVLRSADQVGGAGVPAILDDQGIAGPLGGVVAALRAAAADGRDLILTIPCDTPFLPPDLLQRLSAAIGDHRAAIAASGGRRHPVCALWRTTALAALPDYLATGRRSLSGFADAAGCVGVEWPGDPFFNINDPADLAEAARRIERG